MCRACPVPPGNEAWDSCAWSSPPKDETEPTRPDGCRCSMPPPASESGEVNDVDEGPLARGCRRTPADGRRCRSGPPPSPLRPPPSEEGLVPRLWRNNRLKPLEMRPRNLSPDGSPPDGESCDDKEGPNDGGRDSPPATAPRISAAAGDVGICCSICESKIDDDECMMRGLFGEVGEEVHGSSRDVRAPPPADPAGLLLRPVSDALGDRVSIGPPGDV